MKQQFSIDESSSIPASHHVKGPDFKSVKEKQKIAWSSGNYAAVGVTLQIVGEQLAESMDLKPASNVLDVAAGNGNATLAFARRWHNVTSTDYVEDLLNNGRARAQAEGHEIKFQIADAEALPFKDDEFDAVVSTYGVMFAPHQEQAAQELMRVCRPNGTVGMANWTPSGFIGQLFRTLGQHVPPALGMKSPALWGDETWLNETFTGVASMRLQRKIFNFRYASPEHFVQVFKNLYGPVHKAFQALEPAGQCALEADLLKLIQTFNTASDGSMRVPGEYLEVILPKA